MATEYEVVNWEKFQHYKADRPAWIKAYVAVQDKREYRALPDASKAHLHGIWLLAARIGNQIPDDQEYLMQMLGAHENVDLQILVSAGFLKPCKILHNPERSCEKSPSEVEKRRDREETEGEEIREEKKKLNFNELETLEIETNGFVPGSDIPSIGAFLAGINGKVAEKEALDYEDISYTLNAFFPPVRPGAGTNPAIKAWLGRIPEPTIGSALRYLRAQTYTVDGEEKTWGQLTDEHCKRLITAGLNTILRERG